MTEQPDYLRYLQSAKQAELAEQLRADGFSVETDKRLGNAAFDLVASKGKQQLAYTIKPAGGKQIDKVMLRRLQDSARIAGMEHHIVLVFPPRPVHVEIDDLREMLRNYAIENGVADDIETASWVSIDDLTDLEIEDIHLAGSLLHVKGTASLDVILRHGGGEPEGVTVGNSYPVDFDARLEHTEHGLQLEHAHFNVDTSAFYE